jgi:hypothetical protein
MLLALAAGPARTLGAYEYTDDFSGTRAQEDCYSSSIFWPSDINNPPLRPYLCYCGIGEARGLVLMDFRGELAQLVYGFVVGPTATGTPNRGTLAVDVSFPCNAEVSQYPAGKLFCSTSSDAVVWSAAQSLNAGHSEISIPFTAGQGYVRFTGTHAALNHLRVVPAAAGATIRVSPRPAGAGARPSIFHVDWRYGDDWNDGKSRMGAFKTIQGAIYDNAVQKGDIVVVWPGVYQEEVVFDGKGITIQSAADAAVVMAPDGYAFSFYDAEGRDSVLANVVITGCGVGGIFCDRGAAPTLRNLTIAGNGAGVVVYDNANPYIVNCIIWRNINTQLSAPKQDFNWQITYSCVGPSSPSTVKKTAGNINADPLFGDTDYHLKSAWGRYVPLTDTWVFDKVTSPCIDAGDPMDTPRAEGLLNGWQIDIGAYGGTPFASHSASGPTCK